MCLQEIGATAKTSHAALVAKYANESTQGPTLVCTCCGKTIFPRHSQKITKGRATWVKKYGEKFVRSVVQVSDSDFMCSTCYPKARSGQVPDVSIHNNFKLDDPPAPLRSLNSLEVSRYNLNLSLTNTFTFMNALRRGSSLRVCRSCRSGRWVTIAPNSSAAMW